MTASRILKSIGGKRRDIFLATNLEPYKLLSSKKRNLGIQWIVNGLTNTGLGDFRPEDMDGLLGPVFNYLFRLDSNLLDKVNQARSILGLEGNPYVGVHVRTGFAGAKFQEPDKNPKLVRQQHSWEEILECAVRTADRLLGNDSLIFLACDSIMVKDIAHRRYGQRIRTIHNKLMQMSSHFDHVDGFDLAGSHNYALVHTCRQWVCNVSRTNVLTFRSQDFIIYRYMDFIAASTLQKRHCCFDTSMVTTVALQLVPSSVHGSNVHERNQESCYL